MITITKEQAQNRFTLLPSVLQDAIFSEQTTKIIASIAEQYHLSGEKAEDIASLVGWVFLGFLHLEDLSREIATDIGAAPQLAKDISDSLTNKIFGIIKADVDRAYAPVPHEEIFAEPNIIQNTTIESPTPSNTTPKPTILSDIGWSKQPAVMPLNATAKTSVPTPIPPPVPKPTTTTTPAEPAPMMLHEDTAFKPAEKNAGFTLTKPQGGAEMNFSKNPTAAVPRPAVLEFGGASKPASKPSVPEFKPSSSSAPIANVGSRSISQIVPSTVTPTVPVPKPPTPPTPPSVKNFTAGSIPTPAAPRPLQTPQSPMPSAPTKPSIPVPPVPPSSPQNTPKPIVKDFL